jgi:aspartate racemase
LKKVGLLGTGYTMKADFFKSPFVINGIDIVVPDSREQEYIHHMIVKELEKGMVNPETKKEFLNIITKMIEVNGIQGVILGCTELPMLIKSGDLPIPIFDTMDIHVNKIVETMFNN